MHTVVNHLPMRPDADWKDIAAKFGAFAEKTRAAHPGMKAALLTRSAEKDEAVFIGVYADMATLEHVSSQVAAPWFAENIRIYLNGPVARTVGNVIAGGL